MTYTLAQIDRIAREHQIDIIVNGDDLARCPILYRDNSPDAQGRVGAHRMFARHAANLSDDGGLPVVLYDPDNIEHRRNRDFQRCPILRDYIAAMLDDVQESENYNAQEDDREPVETGTIYTLREITYQQCAALCVAFMRDNAEHIDAALDLIPGEPGLRYGRDYMTHDRIGYYFYMLSVGHGVGFTDDGDAPCLVAMCDYTRANRGAEFYVGDDGNVY